MRVSVFYLFFVLSVLCRYGLGEHTDETYTKEDAKELIKSYENYLNSSRIQTRDDRKIIKLWTDEFLIKRLDVSMMYRLQMVKHDEHCFKVDGNIEWLNCVQLHKKEIKGAKQFYHQSEGECLKSASEDMDRRRDAELIDKQMTQWRKGYRYLEHLCDKENPGDEDSSEQCLVEYMQKDGYDQVIRRLLDLKLKAMSDLYLYLTRSLQVLEKCLKTQLSEYLERVRNVMNILYNCYQNRD